MGKSALNSMTIRGCVLAAAPLIVQILRTLNIEIAEDEVTQGISAAFGIIGLAMAVIGRIRANRPIDKLL